MKLLVIAALLLVQAEDRPRLAVLDDLGTACPRDLVVHETEHYLLELEGSRTEVEDYGALLEAAWEQYRVFLKGKPRFRSRWQPTVKIFATRVAWKKGMEREQQFPPTHIDYVFYSPDRETIFLYRQQLDYFTRKYVLYGAFQQFHRRRKPKNCDLENDWYVTGLADALSTHLWDGAELLLNTQNHLARENRGFQALSRGLSTKIALCDFSEACLKDADLRWALSSFLLRGEEGAYRKRFEKLALGSRGSMVSGRDLPRTLGDQGSLLADLSAWAEADARSLVPVDGRWEEGPRSLAGEELASHRPAIAVTSHGAQLLEVKLRQDSSVGGVVVDWHGQGNCVVLRYEKDILRAERVAGLVRHNLGEVPVPPTSDPGILLRLEREGRGVVVTVNGERQDVFPATGAKFGIFVERGPAVFTELTWR